MSITTKLRNAIHSVRTTTKKVAEHGTFTVLYRLALVCPYSWLSGPCSFFVNGEFGRPATAKELMEDRVEASARLVEEWEEPLVHALKANTSNASVAARYSYGCSPSSLGPSSCSVSTIRTRWKPQQMNAVIPVFAQSNSAITLLSFSTLVFKTKPKKLKPLTKDSRASRL